MKKSSKTEILHSGPRYASGSLHLGTIYNIILKDLLIRSRLFLGFEIMIQYGYDVHGLPIEVLVQKENKLSTYDIKKGPLNFIKLCREKVEENIQKMESHMPLLKLHESFFEKPYYRTDDDAQKKEVYKVFKKLFEKNLIVIESRVNSFCGVCQTALANHEKEKKEVKSKYYYFVRKTNMGDLLIFTKSLWTAANSHGISYNPALEYERVFLEDGRVLIALKSFFDINSLKIVIKKREKFIFEENLILHSTNYKQFSKKEQNNIFADSKHITDFETGIMHLDPFHGEVDELIYPKKNKASLEYFKFLEGEYQIILENPDKMNEKMSKKIEIFKEVDITKDQELCWRCKNILIYISTKEVYINVPKKIKEILSAAKKLKWNSTVEKVGFLNFISKPQKWCLSRSRVYGIEIPLLYCDCKKITLLEFDSKEQNYCKYCNLKGDRIPFLFDVWFESGALYSFYDKEYFVCEAHDQIRGWFYSLIVLQVLTSKKRNFSEVYMHGWVLDKFKEKLSKSTQKEDIGDFIRECIYPMKNWAYSFKIGQDLILESKERIIKEYSHLKNLITNMYSFFEEYLICQKGLSFKNLNSKFFKKYPIEGYLLTRICEIYKKCKETKVIPVEELKKVYTLLSREIIPLRRLEYRSNKNMFFKRGLSAILFLIYKITEAAYREIMLEINFRFSDLKIPWKKVNSVTKDSALEKNILGLIQIIEKIQTLKILNNLSRKDFLSLVIIEARKETIDFLFNFEYLFNSERVEYIIADKVDIKISLEESEKVIFKRAIETFRRRIQEERKVSNRDTFEVLKLSINKNIFKHHSKERSLFSKETRTKLNISKDLKGEVFSYRNLSFEYKI